MRKIKVRFNLGRGKNYMKWKIESESGVEYQDPNEIFLEMKNCVLKNSRKTAEKIFNGDNKTVCAWIKCESISILSITESNNTCQKRLLYNPRKNPFWSNENNENLDGKEFEKIQSLKSSLYV